MTNVPKAHSVDTVWCPIRQSLISNLVTWFIHPKKVDLAFECKRKRGMCTVLLYVLASEMNECLFYKDPDVPCAIASW